MGTETPQPPSAELDDQSPANQAYGAASAFLECFESVVHRAKSFDPSQPRYKKGSLGHLLGHDEVLNRHDEPRLPHDWQDWGDLYGLTLFVWLQLSELVTPAVSEMARRAYPAGAPPIQWASMKPSSTVLGALNELGLLLRGLLYEGRTHPFEVDPAALRAKAMQIVTASKAALGMTPDPGEWIDEFNKLKASETLEVICHRRGITTKSQAITVLASDWKQQRPEHVARIISRLRRLDIDFAAVRVALDREAWAVIEREQADRRLRTLPQHALESLATQATGLDSDQLKKGNAPLPKQSRRKSSKQSARRPSSGSTLRNKSRAKPRTRRSRKYDSSKLTPGERALWKWLHGRVGNADVIAQPDQLNTSAMTIRAHVFQIRRTFGKKAILNRPGYGYFRPDAPPRWDTISPKRVRRVRTA